MKNTKHHLRQFFLFIGIWAAVLLSGCGAENVSPKEQQPENLLPGKAVTEQVISEWKEMYGSFYDYQNCSIVLSKRTENNGTVEEIFTIDIAYLSGQPDNTEPEHFIADMKAVYPADNPNEITLWMDNSGGAMTDLILFQECGSN